MDCTELQNDLASVGGDLQVVVELGLDEGDAILAPVRSVSLLHREDGRKVVRLYADQDPA